MIGDKKACPFCGGEMVCEYTTVVLSSDPPMDEARWRCGKCGETQPADPIRRPALRVPPDWETARAGGKSGERQEVTAADVGAMPPGIV